METIIRVWNRIRIIASIRQMLTTRRVSVLREIDASTHRMRMIRLVSDHIRTIVSTNPIKKRWPATAHIHRSVSIHLTTMHVLAESFTHLIASTQATVKRWRANHRIRTTVNTPAMEIDFPAWARIRTTASIRRTGILRPVSQKKSSYFILLTEARLPLRWPRFFVFIERCVLYLILGTRKRNRVLDLLGRKFIGSSQ
jgi:hypothetical protein